MLYPSCVHSREGWYASNCANTSKLSDYLEIGMECVHSLHDAGILMR